jgi:hypothetical protein
MMAVVRKSAAADGEAEIADRPSDKDYKTVETVDALHFKKYCNEFGSTNRSRFRNAVEAVRPCGVARSP